MESWKDVPGYEGRYQVSDAGRVRSTDWVEPITACRWGGPSARAIPGRVIKQLRDDRGRAFVGLTKGKRSRRWRVSALVALTFIGPRPESALVLHGDGDHGNDAAANLRYGTHRDNVADARQHGTLALGEKQWLSKLTAANVGHIRHSDEPGVSLASRFGVTPACISAVRRGKNWRHV